MSEVTINNTGEINISRNPQTVPRMVTVDELSELVNISTYTIRRWVNEGKIIYIKSGSKILINYDKFIDFLNGEL